MTYRLRNIAIAVALAIVAALLTTFYVTNYKRTVQRGAEDVTVYVATSDIVAGTPGSEVLENGLLKTQEIARRNVAPGAISSPDQIARLVAVDPVYAGEQVTVTRFRSSEEKGVRSELSGNLRAIQVPGSEHQLLAGTLKAGDHVDVVASLKYKFVNFVKPKANSDKEELTAARIVLRDLLVLRGPASTSTTSKLTESVNQAPSVLLAVTDSQAQKLFFVTTNGDWSLELRPTDDPADSPESVETVGSVLGDGLHQEQLQELITGRRSFDDNR